MYIHNVILSIKFNNNNLIKTILFQNIIIKGKHTINTVYNISYIFCDHVNPIDKHRRIIVFKTQHMVCK